MVLAYKHFQMTSNTTAADKRLKANYESPGETKAFVHHISSSCPSDPSVEQKTAYLSELRHSARKLQEQINVFLTEKMAQDKARDVQSSTKDSTSRDAKSKDEIEEENYGEEQPEDD